MKYKDILRDRNYKNSMKKKWPNIYLLDTKILNNAY